TRWEQSGARQPWSALVPEQTWARERPKTPTARNRSSVASLLGYEPIAFPVPIERRHLRDEIDRRHGRFDAGDALRDLMGPSRQIEQVVQQIERVADSPLTILIQGETGTGKEFVARAIHRLSARRDRRFVAIDCGAIPETLIESELFGHEKGAFTGAEQRREGRL